MHPKENKADRKLVYACNRCSYKEDAQSGSCVYRNNLITTAGNKLDIVQTDVVDDPTLQRSKNAICEKCNYNEAVFFQADEGAKSQSLSLIFVCTNRACGHKPYWSGCGGRGRPDDLFDAVPAPAEVTE
eukprot:g6658.t1